MWKMERLEKRKKSCKILSYCYGMVIAQMNSQKQCLPIQGLHKIGPPTVYMDEGWANKAPPVS